MFFYHSLVFSQVTKRPNKVLIDYGGLLKYGDSTRLVWAYTSLEEARKVPPDSVFGLDLISCGLKDFPEEILNYKNLVVFWIDSYFWEDVKDSLSSKQKKKLAKKKIGLPDNFPIHLFWRESTIKNLPEGIKNLKQLKYVSIGYGINIKNKKKFMKIYEYLPNTYIYTGYEEDSNHKKNLDEVNYNLELGKKLEEKNKKDKPK